MSIHVDASVSCVVVWCDECNWRAIRGSRAAAWGAGAIHAKKVHNDRAAAGNARTNFMRQRKMMESKEY